MTPNKILSPGDMESIAWKPGYLIDEYGNAINHLEGIEKIVVDMSDEMIYNWLHQN